MKLSQEKSLTTHWLDAWHVNPSPNRDWDFIDGLRGIAILMVIVDHYCYVNPRSGSTVQFISHLVSASGRGVTLFFAISGFLISWPFWKRKVENSLQVIPLGYAGRRFWKIYPPLALSILLLTPIYVFRYNDWSYAAIAAQWLTGVSFFAPVSGKLNPVMWTLVVEIQFYIVLPLVFLAFQRVSAKMCLWLVTLLFFVVPIVVQAVIGHSATFYPYINAYFPTALGNFCLGILIAGLNNLGVLNKKWAWLGDVGLILLPLALLMIGWLSFYSEHQSPELSNAAEWMVRIASGCLLCYVADPTHSRIQLLRTPWLRWCGIISYEWYLFHQPIVLWARESFGPAQGNPFIFVTIVGGSLLVGLIVAAIVYRYFSLPILKYGRPRCSG